MKPNYSPNTVNQTVEFGGITWRGQPGGDWQQVGVSGRPAFDAPAPDPIEQAKKIRQFNIESNQPAIASLEASKSPLQSKYNDLIGELTRREGVEVGQTNTALSREYGKRGIPLSSGAFTQDLAEKQRPTSEFYAGQRNQAATASEQGISEINNLIAQLQSGDPQSSIAAAMQLTQLAQQGRQNDIENALALRRFNEYELPLSQAQIANYNKPSNSEDRYLTVGEGSSIFDLLGGKSIYTAPKTYKAGDGSSDPY